MSKEEKFDKISVYEAAYEGDFETVKRKLDNDLSLLLRKDDNGRIVMHWAALSGNVKLVTYLLELNSPFDADDETCTTPLILAASAGRLEIVKLLLQLNADIDHKTDQGHSALQYACSKGWLEISKLLLDSSAEINIKDNRGATPLHRAASKGNLDIVNLLVLYKNDLKIDATDNYGNTPLHLACEEDRRDEAVVLVRNGADTSLTNKDRKTPLELCTVILHRLLITQFPHLIKN